MEKKKRLRRRRQGPQEGFGPVDLKKIKSEGGEWNPSGH